MTKTTFWKNFTLALSSVLFFGVPVFAQTADQGVGGHPAFPDPTNPRTKSIFVYEPHPGDNIQTGIVVTNSTKEKKTVLIYGVDAEVASQGSFACKQQAEQSQEVGQWLEFSKSEVTLDPNSNVTVPFAIQVPKDIPGGEYDGCVVIQEKRDPVAAGNGIGLSFRTALRVVITVPGSLEKRLSLTQLKVDELKVNRSDHKVVFRPVLRNDGNVSIDTDLTVTARGFLKLRTYQNNGTFPVLARSTAEYSFEKKKSPWGGFWTATATARYDPDPSHRLGTPGAKVASAQIKKTYFIVPTWWAALFELLVLLAIGYLLWRLIRRIRAVVVARRHWGKYQVKPHETIRDIADRTGVSWKTIARVNKLKPPYTLTSGETIKVPATGISKKEVSSQSTTSRRRKRE